MIRKHFQWLLLTLWLFSCETSERHDPLPLLNHVDPFIGTAGWGNVHPGAVAPHGLSAVIPTNIGLANAGRLTSGYHFYRFKLSGFTFVNHPALHKKFGELQLLPIKSENAELSSGYSDEVASPGFYQTHLDDHEVLFQSAVMPRSGAMQMTYSNSEAKFFLQGSLANDSSFIINRISESQLGIQKLVTTEEAVIKSVFVVIEFDQPITDFGLKNDELTNTYGAMLSFDLPQQKLVVKFGVSLQSVDNALDNLNAEIGLNNFESVKQYAANLWQSNLEVVLVETRDPEKSKLFYSALYRFLQYPTLISDVNGDRYQFDDDTTTLVYTKGEQDFMVLSSYEDYYLNQQLWKLLDDSLMLRHPRTQKAIPYATQKISLDSIESSYHSGMLKIWKKGDRNKVMRLLESKPWKANLIIDESRKSQFNGYQFGLPGKDAYGALSGWLISSMLGVYPDPHRHDYYTVFSPDLSGTSVNTTSNKLSIKKDVEENRFIRELRLGGVSTASTSFSLLELKKADTLSIITHHEPEDYDLRNRISGMIYGTLIGDAAGGPFEFKSSPKILL